MTDHTPTPETAVCGAPCRSTRHCADHGWCRRCNPERARVGSAINVAIQQHATEDEWGSLYAAVMAAVPTPETATRTVQGCCPACGRTSLITGTGGYIICGHLECPDPEAATRLLERGPVTADFAEAGKQMPALYAKLTDALGLTPSASWDDTTERAASVTAAAVERAAALHDARDALGAAGYGPDGDDWPAIAPAIRALAADVKLLRGNSEVDRREASCRREALADTLGLGTGAGWDAITDRSRQVTAQLADYENRITWETTCGEHARLLDGAYAETARAEQAEAKLQATTEALILWRDRPGGDVGLAIAIGNILDASKPEPSAARVVRALRACDRLQAAHTNSHGESLSNRDEGVVKAVERIRAALDGEQPATESEERLPWMDLLGALEEPEPPCFHSSWETEPTVGARKCTDCGEWLDPEPPAPAPEFHVHVNVTPQQVADAVRRILRDDRSTLRDVLR